MVLWITLVPQGEDASIFSRTGSDKREKEIVFVISVAAIMLLVALQTFGAHALGFVTWFSALGALGALIVWRGSTSAERSHLQELMQTPPIIGAAPGEGWRWFALRAGASAVFIVLGISLLSRVGGKPGAAAGVLVGAIALVGGLFVLFAPWWIRVVRDLSKERLARIRAQERSDMAAHVHDSVLQTLSLIQRAVDNPTEVSRLVRIQERDLRNWLVDPESFGAAQSPPTTLAASALEIEREVEDSYGIGVDVIVVGDYGLDERVLALLSAGREATVNAAKWSGAQAVSIYLEVTPKCISMFIRDLGCGFETAAIPKDRQGISGSIVDRMVRHGGLATIKSAPGAGTEIELVLPLKSNKP